MKLRVATRRDAAAIASLHAASWRSAYREVIPARRLGPALDGDRRRHWQAMMARAKLRDVVPVAEDGMQVIGFIAVWLEGQRAYIDNLHVQPKQRGKRIGERLMRAAARRLARVGRHEVYLWAFVANQAALRFYARLGGKPTGRAFDRFLRSQAPCQRMSWRRFERLAF